MPTGTSTAMTAALLIASVSVIARNEKTAKTATGVVAQDPITVSTIHLAAPLLSRAEARMMAPPYMSMMPQLTYSSMSFHLTSLSMKRTTTEERATVESPMVLPRNIHPRMVRTS